jgi:hypothetical protein
VYGLLKTQLDISSPVKSVNMGRHWGFLRPASGRDIFGRNKYGYEWCE